MISATIATLAMAALVYAFILSPIIRELRGGAVQEQPLEMDLDDDGVSADADAPQTSIVADAVVGSQPPASERTAAAVGAGAAAGTATTATPPAHPSTTTTPSASASSSDA